GFHTHRTLFGRGGGPGRNLARNAMKSQAEQSGSSRDACRTHPATAVARRAWPAVRLTPANTPRRCAPMNRRHIISAVVLCLATALPTQGTTLRCPPDSVKVGDTCIDTYEASVWQIDPANTTLVRKVQTGRATLADLTAGGATPVSSPACNV